MSGATAWKPASASAASWWRQEYQDSGKPWHMMTSGPVPCSATCMRMPLVSIVRWVISLTPVSYSFVSAVTRCTSSGSR